MVNKQTAIYNAMNKLICATTIKKVDEFFLKKTSAVVIFSSPLSFFVFCFYIYIENQA